MKIKVCTFNVRCECDKSPNSVEDRCEYLYQEIKKENADIIGFQEISPFWRKYLGNKLNDEYYFLGTGRNHDYEGEGVSIGVKKARFDILKFEQFWLSFDPLEPGSTFGGDQSIYPRTCVYGILVDKDTKKKLLFINTHLDHEGKIARRKGALLVLDKIKEINLPTILTGDMNEIEGEAISLYNKELIDTSKNVDGTYHAYGTIKPWKIDYIFTNIKNDDYMAYSTCKDKVDKDTYVSDHQPVYCYIEI